MPTKIKTILYDNEPIAITSVADAITAQHGNNLVTLQSILNFIPTIIILAEIKLIKDSNGNWSVELIDNKGIIDINKVDVYESEFNGMITLTIHSATDLSQFNKMRNYENNFVLLGQNSMTSIENTIIITNDSKIVVDYNSDNITSTHNVRLLMKYYFTKDNETSVASQGINESNDLGIID